MENEKKLLVVRTQVLCRHVGKLVNPFYDSYSYSGGTKISGIILLINFYNTQNLIQCLKPI